MFTLKIENNIRALFKLHQNVIYTVTYIVNITTMYCFTTKIELFKRRKM